tara:strand:- start:1192 stop:2982 length:1791 start_codon:yes stop_codon:yes gene_type:complete
MENLFIEPIEQEKQAMVSVSEDSTKWVKEIIGSLLKSFPELADTPLQIAYHQKDADKGFAVASIQADGFSIPAVISDYNLSPLDVIVVNGIMLPLTKTTLIDLISNSNAFDSVVKGRKELTTQVFDSPLNMPTGLGGQDFTLSETPVTSKYSSLIDKVSSFVERKDYERLISEITRPENYAGFVKNETLDIIEKISELKPSTEVDFAEATLSNLDIDRQMVVEDDLGNRSIKQANSSVDYTWTTRLDPEDTMVNKFASFEKQDSPKLETSPGNTYPIEEGILYLTKEGEYYVFNKEEHTKIASRVQNFEVKGSMPNMNDYGVFVVGEHATSPFEVVGLQKIAGAGNFEIRGWDGLNHTTYIPLKGINKEAMIPHEEYDNTYYVPGNGKFVKLAGELHVTFEAIDSDLDKNYVEQDEIGLFSLNGPGFTKYGASHSLRDLSEEDAKWAAIHCGATVGDIAKMARLVPNSHAKLAGKIKSPVPTSDMQAVIEAEYDKAVSSLPTFDTVLVKEASTLANKNSVDAILSLGLMNKRNIMEYISYIPQYEQCESELAKLLIAARLGLPNVEALDIKEAMEGLASVIYALKGLQSIIDDNSK